LSGKYRGSSTESENSLTRTIAIIALSCFLVAGVAAASMLERASVPRLEMASPVVEGPVTNAESKQDRLAIASVAPTPLEPSLALAPTADLKAPLRQAFASAAESTAPAEVEAPKITTPVAPPSPKPKLATKPPPQKPYALLSDAQIAGIKERLRLSSAQESYWPGVERALRAVAKKIHATRQAYPHATGAPIDPEAEEIQQLKSAAMPLLFQLREDQKREVRTLARLIGLESVAAQI
jgi:hypothetical protein